MQAAQRGHWSTSTAQPHAPLLRCVASPRVASRPSRQSTCRGSRKPLSCMCCIALVSSLKREIRVAASMVPNRRSERGSHLDPATIRDSTCEGPYETPISAWSLNRNQSCLNQRRHGLPSAIENAGLWGDSNSVEPGTRAVGPELPTPSA